MIVVETERTIDLWEAWIDQECPLNNGAPTLYVIGEVFTGSSKTTPVLVKKKVQGAETDNLYLEVMPCIIKDGGRLAEVRYSETLQALAAYTAIFICAGEDVIAQITDIETLF